MRNKTLEGFTSEEIRTALKLYKKGRRFTEEQLRELHEQGLNDREIGEKLGARECTVGRHRRRLGLKPVRKHGVEASTRKRLFTDQQLIELHEQGYNDREIGKKLGATRSTVGDHRCRLGLEAHWHRRLFTDQQLKELHEQGLNDTQIGEKLGADECTVGRHRNRLGLKPVRKHGIKALSRRRLFTDEQLIKLLEKGYNDREIGKKLGATRNTVGRHRRRLGLEAHDAKRPFTDQQLKELHELHEQGFNDGEIAMKLGVGKRKVRYYRIKLGLTSIYKSGARARGAVV